MSQLLEIFYVDTLYRLLRDMGFMEARLSKIEGSGELGSRLVEIVKQKVLVSDVAVASEGRGTSLEAPRPSGDGTKR